MVGSFRNIIFRSNYEIEYYSVATQTYYYGNNTLFLKRLLSEAGLWFVREFVVGPAFRAASILLITYPAKVKFS